MEGANEATHKGNKNSISSSLTARFAQKKRAPDPNSAGPLTPKRGCAGFWNILKCTAQYIIRSVIYYNVLKYAEESLLASARVGFSWSGVGSAALAKRSQITLT